MKNDIYDIYVLQNNTCLSQATITSNVMGSPSSHRTHWLLLQMETRQISACVLDCEALWRAKSSPSHPSQKVFSEARNNSGCFLAGSLVCLQCQESSRTLPEVQSHSDSQPPPQKVACVQRRELAFFFFYTNFYSPLKKIPHILTAHWLFC